MGRVTGSAWLLSAVMVMLVVAPGSASAATLGTSGSEMDYRGTPGGKDNVLLKYRRNRDFYLVDVSNDGGTVNASSFVLTPPCVRGPDPDDDRSPDLGVPTRPANVITGCPANGLKVTDVKLGDNNDQLEYERDENYTRPGSSPDQQGLKPIRPLSIHADGGSGSDQLQGGPLADKLFGGSGNDSLNGVSTGRGDLIRGGSGKDRVIGGGRDRIYGDSGKDVLEGMAGSDRVFGGSGNDEVNGGGTFARGDRRDRIYGGSGNDTLKDFQSGKDTAGDRFFGGPGRDKIADRDGNRDLIDCGRGRDYVFADRKDKVARNCEKVNRGTKGK